MKKLLLVLAVSISLVSYSQTKIGVHAGINYSSTRGGFSKYYAEKGGVGFLVGANSEFNLNKNLSLRLELNCESKKIIGEIDHFNGLIKHDPTDALAQYSFERVKNNYYLVLPILLKYRFTDFYINSGGFAGVLIASKVTTNKKILTNYYNNNTNSDFGFVFGLGKEFKKINIELRNNLGLTNRNNVDKIKSNSINLIVGMRLN